MELVFTTPGAYLNVKDGLFSISIDIVTNSKPSFFRMCFIRC
jgi:hypothetical protein